MKLCPFKKFKNIFGQAGKGLHSVKILDTAIVDYILSIILAFILAWITDIPVVLMTIIVFILGIFFHMLFGINTNSIKYLNLIC